MEKKFSKKLSIFILLSLSSLFTLFILLKANPYPFSFFSDDYQYFNVAQNISTGKGAYKNYINHVFYAGDLVNKNHNTELWKKTRGYHLPTYSSLLGASMFLSGDFMRGFYILQFLAFQVLILLIFLISYSLTKNSLVSFLTGILVISSPSLGRYLSIAMPEIVVICLFLMAVYFSLLEEKKLPYFIELLLFTFLVCLKKNYSVFIFFISMKKFFSLPQKRPLETLKVFSLSFFPFLILEFLNTQDYYRPVGKYTLGLKNLSYNFFHSLPEKIDFLLYETFSLNTYLELFLHLGLFAGIFLLFQRKYKSPFFVLSLFLLINSAALFVFYGWHSELHTRNLIWFYPILTIFLMYKAQQHTKGNRKKIFLAFSFLFLLSLPANYQLHYELLKIKTEIARNRVAFLKELSKTLQQKYPQSKYIATDRENLVRLAIFNLDKNFSYQLMLRINRRSAIPPRFRKRASRVLKIQKKSRQFPNLFLLEKREVGQIPELRPYLGLLKMKEITFHPEKNLFFIESKRHYAKK